jgi:hypothetical protein
MRVCQSCKRVHSLSDPCVTIEMLESEVNVLHAENIRHQKKFQALESRMGYIIDNYNRAMKVISNAQQFVELLQSGGKGSILELEKSLKEWNEHVARETEASSR